MHLVLQLLRRRYLPQLELLALQEVEAKQQEGAAVRSQRGWWSGASSGLWI